MNGVKMQIECYSERKKMGEKERMYMHRSRTRNRAKGKENCRKRANQVAVQIITIITPLATRCFPKQTRYKTKTNLNDARKLQTDEK